MTVIRSEPVERRIRRDDIGPYVMLDNAKLRPPADSKIVKFNIAVVQIRCDSGLSQRYRSVRSANKPAETGLVSTLAKPEQVEEWKAQLPPPEQVEEQRRRVKLRSLHKKSRAASFWGEG